MKILALDISSIVATCAIIDDKKLLGEYILNHKRTHSQKIMPMVRELLTSCELTTDDIDIYAAAIGPGSFTGLRIGSATIKALAHATDKHVVGIPTIDALAYNLSYCKGLIVPIMDARRNRVYTGIYQWIDGKFQVVKQQDVLEVTELLDILKDRDESIIFNGDGIEVYKDVIVECLGNRALFAPKHSNMARASSVAELAMIKAKEGKTESYFDLVPDYLRKSQAEREYEERQLRIDN